VKRPWYVQAADMLARQKLKEEPMKEHKVTEALIRYYWPDADPECRDFKRWIGDPITLCLIAEQIEEGSRHWGSQAREFFRKVLDREWGVSDASRQAMADRISGIKYALIARLDALEKEKGPEVVESCGLPSDPVYSWSGIGREICGQHIDDKNGTRYYPERPVEELAVFLRQTGVYLDEPVKDAKTILDFLYRECGKAVRHR